MSDNRPDVQTYTAVAGNHCCNAHCPYCVSKQTPCHREDNSLEVDWINFDAGAKYAMMFGAATFLITSKGEATLFPDQITTFIMNGHRLGFPIIELQTNGLLLRSLAEKGHLKKWKKEGLNLVALSCVSARQEVNKDMIGKGYLDLEESVKILHDHGISVRLSCIMIRGLVHDLERSKEMIQYANRIGVEQLKLYPVSLAKNCLRNDIKEWLDQRIPLGVDMTMLKQHLDACHVTLRHLAHGDTVYSYSDDETEDQNVAFGSCLTESSGNDIRQVIYCRDGHVRYSWQYKSAILF